jgi:hypothetical protein
VNVVTASGEAMTINHYTDPDYFWALRGGGGSAWGIITSVVYKTHPLPTHIQAVLVQINATSNATLRTIYEKALAALPGITDAGYTGYGDLDGTFQAIFSQANATNETFTKAFMPFMEIGKLEGVSAQLAPIIFPTWIDYGTYFLTDPNIATNIIDASRLLTADVLTNKSGQLIDLIFENPTLAPGFNYSRC